MRGIVHERFHEMEGLTTCLKKGVWIERTSVETENTVTIRRSEKLGRSAKLMARPLAHSCPFAGRFGGLREVSDIEEDQRRSIEGKGVSRSLGESMEVE